MLNIIDNFATIGGRKRKQNFIPKMKKLRMCKVEDLTNISNCVFDPFAYTSPATVAAKVMGVPPA